MSTTVISAEPIGLQNRQLIGLLSQMAVPNSTNRTLLALALYKPGKQIEQARREGH